MLLNIISKMSRSECFKTWLKVLRLKKFHNIKRKHDCLRVLYLQFTASICWFCISFFTKKRNVQQLNSTNKAEVLETFDKNNWATEKKVDESDKRRKLPEIQPVYLSRSDIGLRVFLCIKLFQGKRDPFEDSYLC